MIVAPVEFERIVQCGCLCGDWAQAAELIASRTRRRPIVIVLTGAESCRRFRTPPPDRGMDYDARTRPPRRPRRGPAPRYRSHLVHPTRAAESACRDGL